MNTFTSAIQVGVRKKKRSLWNRTLANNGSYHLGIRVAINLLTVGFPGARS